MFQEALRKKPQSMSFRIAIVPAEIRAENLSTTNLEHYSYTSLSAGLLISLRGNVMPNVEGLSPTRKD
jgi:hypothetical protein